MKNYFLCYWSWDDRTATWCPNNIIIEKHPVQWFKDKCYKYVVDNDGNLVHHYLNSTAIRLGFWEEVSEEDVK